MTARITFFPVANGDMTLVQLESGRNILIDMNIRTAADDPDDETPDVAAMLRERLKRDDEGRLHVDALVLSHPDKDHCLGLRKHFHLGPPAEWSANTDKILARELWSSPQVFRRASKRHTLCEDAKAFNTEARRRVRRYRERRWGIEDGDRILILGEDEDGKTDDIEEIVVSLNSRFSCVNGLPDGTIEARLLAPISEDAIDEEVLTKNNNSVVIQFSITGGGIADKCRYLACGDTEVAIWEVLWRAHAAGPDWLSYDVLLTPHHCSWHSLSHDSWSKLGEAASVSEDARRALSQARPGATVVVSSKAIKDDDDDPPCIRAKREYVKIADGVSGQFRCVGENPSEDAPNVTEIEIDGSGPRLLSTLSGGLAGGGATRVGRQPIRHG